MFHYAFLLLFTHPANSNSFIIFFCLYLINYLFFLIFLFCSFCSYFAILSTETATGSFFRTHGDTENLPPATSLAYFGIQKYSHSDIIFSCKSIFFFSNLYVLIIFSAQPYILRAYFLLKYSAGRFSC